MTVAGDMLFAAAGDTIYKISISNMRIEGQVKIPQPQPQFQAGGGQGQQRRGGQQGGGNIPPSSK